MWNWPSARKVSAWVWVNETIRLSFDTRDSRPSAHITHSNFDLSYLHVRRVSQTTSKLNRSKSHQSQLVCSIWKTIKNLMNKLTRMWLIILRSRSFPSLARSLNWVGSVRAHLRELWTIFKVKKKTEFFMRLNPTHCRVFGGVSLSWEKVKWPFRQQNVNYSRSEEVDVML